MEDANRVLFFSSFLKNCRIVFRAIQKADLSNLGEVFLWHDGLANSNSGGFHTQCAIYPCRRTLQFVFVAFTEKWNILQTLWSMCVLFARELLFRKQIEKEKPHRQNRWNVILQWNFNTFSRCMLKTQRAFFGTSSEFLTAHETRTRKKLSLIFWPAETVIGHVNSDLTEAAEQYRQSYEWQDQKTTHKLVPTLQQYSTNFPSFSTWKSTSLRVCCTCASSTASLICNTPTHEKTCGHVNVSAHFVEPLLAAGYVPACKECPCPLAEIWTSVQSSPSPKRERKASPVTNRQNILGSSAMYECCDTHCRVLVERHCRIVDSVVQICPGESLVLAVFVHVRLKRQIRTISRSWDQRCHEKQWNLQETILSTKFFILLCCKTREFSNKYASSA